MRRGFTHPLLAIFCILFMLPASAQEKTKWPKTLLWKIERADLKKPSFLFGTMHVTDKRIFNLTDSFYHFFEKAEGFAIEVNFNEYIDSILQKSFIAAEEKEFRDEEDPTVIVDEEGKGIIEAVIDTAVSVADSEFIAPPPPPQELLTRPSRKVLRRLRNERVRRLLIYGEMPTILDAYLYGMAMKQNKWLGAVEDVKDQLNLRDEMGKDIDDADYLKPEDEQILELETMIKTYLSQDLNKVESYVNNYGSEKAKTLMFHNRNYKMANSIDSLSHQRSMFYAVGTAHLPGDSGVITLLRNRGYRVTPVLSTKTLAAEKYAAKLPSLAWHQVQQADSLFTIEMPGIPTDYNLFGDLVKMKVFVDITTMTFYMTGHTIAQFSDDKLNDALKNVAQSMSPGSRPQQVKRVDRNNLKGVEGMVESEGIFFKVQILKKENVVYFLMTGGESKAKPQGADATRFFNSFKPGKSPRQINPDWKEFGLPEKAFTVMMPATPKRNKTFERQAIGSGWNFTVYDYTDLSSGLYFVMQVRDIEPGMVIDGDSSYFRAFRDHMEASDLKPLREETDVYEGFSTLRLDGVSTKEDLFYKTKNIVRGNRVYTLLVLGHESKKYASEGDEFLDSFRFTDYAPSTHEVHTADDGTFSTRATSPFVRAKPEEPVPNRTVHTSYNPANAVSYEVVKDHFPELFWTENDSVFFAMQTKGMVSYGDSVLSSRKVRNGALAGVEEVVLTPGSSNLKKYRMLLHGDTLYTLITYIPQAYIDQPGHQDFFREFRIANDSKAATSIFTPKADRLFAALEQSDSAGFDAAVTTLRSITFTKNDLPQVRNALLKSYRDDSLSYGSVKSTLIRSMTGLTDDATVDFIRDHYDELKGQGDNQVALLNVLANYQSAYAYTLLKDLWINKTPSKLEDRTMVGYSVSDSLLLTKTLFPELLALLANKDFSEEVTRLTIELMDSNMLSPAVLKPYARQIRYMADTLISGQTLAGQDYWWWPYGNIVKLAGHLNDDSSNAIVARYLSLQDVYLKRTAVVALVRNGKTVDAAHLEAVAASVDNRMAFYEELKKAGKLHLFPEKFRTQRYFAESQVHEYSDEDYTPDAIEFIESREALFNGEKKRFFLFRLIYRNEEEGKSESYLGMAGPFELDPRNLESNKDALEINFDEAYNKKTLDTDFRNLLRKGEEYSEKRRSEQ